MIDDQNIIFLSPISVDLPSSTETFVEFECVPTYSKTLVGHFVAMDGTRITSEYALQSGLRKT